MSVSRIAAAQEYWSKTWGEVDRAIVRSAEILGASKNEIEELLVSRNPISLELLRGRVLDVGCGPRSDLLRKEGVELIECDALQSVLSVAREKSSEWRQRICSAAEWKPVGLVASDVLYLPFRDSSIRTVVAFKLLSVLEAHDFEPALRELSRVAERYIAFTVHCLGSAQEEGSSVGKKEGYVYTIYGSESNRQDRTAATMADMERLLADFSLMKLRLDFVSGRIYVEAEKG
ncbi:MAG: methyltransferase domain-containing protein [Candidatus Micrarchaeales archaeon]|nr:methyltransferase domain-containing protein [Candidatus Micrarchaeales archaeon]